MIITNITGGFGNQMFQYAAGRRLACIHKTDLKLDTAQYKKGRHKFLLDKFRIQADTATKKEINSLININLLNLYQVIPSRFQPIYAKVVRVKYKTLIFEKHFHFDESILHTSDNLYLLGYWQSERYFSGIADIIRKEFVLKDQLSEESREILSAIKNANSISINIRRGDYITNYYINKKHGVLDLSYYKWAISYLAQRVKRPYFFLFSDDMPWVKKNLKFGYPAQYMDFNYPEKVYEDLILGSCCKHNILANSSFSWWVGWLNNNREKIVIAPKKWFRDPSLNTKDLIPKSWVRL